MPLAARLGVVLTISDVPHVPAPEAGPVRDALDVVIQLALNYTKQLPEGHPVRDRVDHATETLMMLQDGSLPEVGLTLPEALDKILFGRGA